MDIDTPLPHVFCPASELRAVREGMSFSMFDPPRGPVQSPGGHTTCLLPMTGRLSVVNDSCGSPQRDFSGPHSQPIPFNSPFLMTYVCLLPLYLGSGSICLLEAASFAELEVYLQCYSLNVTQVLDIEGALSHAAV